MIENAPKDPPASWSMNAPAAWKEMVKWMKARPGTSLYVGTHLVEDVPRIMDWLAEKFGGSWGFFVEPAKDISKCFLFVFYKSSANQKIRRTEK